MDLTIDQAAVAMGKTVRQVRYLIQQGRLPARKQGRVWVIRKVKTTMLHLARGCHRFDRRAKADAYQAARDAASVAVCELLMDDREGLDAQVHTLEQEFMPAVAGLLRRLDRKPVHERGRR